MCTTVTATTTTTTGGRRLPLLGTRPSRSPSLSQPFHSCFLVSTVRKVLFASVLTSVVLSSLSCLVLPVQAANSQTQTFNISFPTASGNTDYNVVHDDFLGISFELAPFDTLWGSSPSALPNAMKNYLHNIVARTTHPLRIRIGGNSMDASTYVPSQSQMIIQTDKDAYFNDIPVTFGPVFFDVLNAMADALPTSAGKNGNSGNGNSSLTFIIGLSMQDPSDDSNVIELAGSARAALGDRLDAMLLGNEPDLYAGHGTRANYTIQDYIPEVGSVLKDLANSENFGNITNTSIIGGPSICCSWSLSDVLNAGLDKYSYKYYTLQHYPTYVCDGYTAASSNISYYISHTNVAPFLQWNDDGIELAKKLGVPLLLTEYNSASCGGDPTVAPTFATALWAADVALKAASLNFSGVFLHTREYGITYNLFDPPSTDNPLPSKWSTGAVYYATLVVAESLSNGLGLDISGSADETTGNAVVLDLNLNGSTTNPSATVAAYGIYTPSNSTSSSSTNISTWRRSRLVLFNFSYSHSNSSSVNTTQTFLIPSTLAKTIGVRLLTAPNISSTAGDVTWAGQRVGANGELEGDQALDVVSCGKDGCSVSVPGPGLGVVWLDPVLPSSSGSGSSGGVDVFVGNSTIAGVYSGAPPRYESGILRPLILLASGVGLGLVMGL